MAAALVARDGRILETNRTLERRVGSQEWIHEMVAPGQAGLVSDLVASAGTQWRSIQAGLLRAGGDPVDCKISAIEHRDQVLVLAEQLRAPGERLYAVLLELNDEMLRARRDLAAQNRQLRELDELKNMFIASSTHDLKQPLTSLLAYAEMLGDEGLSPEAGRMALIIEKNARRMTVMLNDLLGAATIMTGELRLECSWTDVAALVQTAMDGIDPAAQGGGVTITHRGPESALAFVDERRVAQILDNLLSNAVKYSPGGQVSVECKASEDTVIIVVADTGIGIPPDVQEQLFDKYFRASTALGHGIDGTGLGLANARAFAQAHGGTLTCSSAPGTGSMFTLTLPDGADAVSP